MGGFDFVLGSWALKGSFFVSEAQKTVQIGCFTAGTGEERRGRREEESRLDFDNG